MYFTRSAYTGHEVTTLQPDYITCSHNQHSVSKSFIPSYLLTHVLKIIYPFISTDTLFLRHGLVHIYKNNFVFIYSFMSS